MTVIKCNSFSTAEIYDQVKTKKKNLPPAKTNIVVKKLQEDKKDKAKKK